MPASGGGMHLKRMNVCSTTKRVALPRWLQGPGPMTTSSGPTEADTWVS